jgi:hypothetical protein
VLRLSCCFDKSFPSGCQSNKKIEAEGGDYQSVYDALVFNGFGVQSDGSLSSSGIEVQVPASNGGKTYELVLSACNCLEENGFQVSKRCGLHVHVEYKSRFKTIKHLLLMIYACEPVFYAINPPSRQNNNFCQPLLKNFIVSEIINTKAEAIDQLFYSKKHKGLTQSKIKDFKKSKFANS